MASYINTNIASLNAQRNLTMSQSGLTTALQRLSSGLRINSAKDDAAGLAISERMTSQINGSNQAARNANDGISLAQTAEGDLAQIGTNLQTMRNLAVQSANATNSTSDRAALDAQYQQLSAENDRIAQTASFNGVKLLDGSFNAQNFQVGANNTSGDQITIAAIASARSAALGGSGTSTATTVTSGVTSAALTAGGLTLNGFQVGASTVGAGAGQSADSAFSIAAAINAVSAQSGVTSTANANTVTGSSATVFTAIAANTFSINGISVGAVTAGANASGQGANMAAAINAVSGQSGVTATANATTGALTLTAADGRDISIGMVGSAANAATATANKTALLNQTGLTTGTVGTQAVTATPTSTVASGAVSGGAVTVAGTTATTYSLTVDGFSLYSGSVASGATGSVFSGASPGATLDTAWTAFAAAHTGYSLTGTFSAGTAVITKADGTAITTASTLVTGAGATVSAVAYAGASFIGTTAAAGPAAAAVVANNSGTITLSSSNSTGITVGGAAVASAGLALGTTAPTTTLSVNSISSANLLTASSSTSSLTAIDGAINTINSSRAALGAYQNRFASAVSSLQTTSENLSAARSRIQDTDFAAETANLTRGQILQQAGTAMLAQANALPNGVLALLR
jgi:flagellin